MTVTAITTMLFAFSSIYRDKREKENDALQIQIWANAMKDVPDDVGLTAAKMCINEMHFRPAPADVLERIERLKAAESGESNIAYWQEAWSGICGKTEWKDLSEPVRRWFGSRSAMDELGYSTNTVESVVKGQFMKSFPQVLKQYKTRKQMNPKIRRAVQEMLSGKEPKGLIE